MPSPEVATQRAQGSAYRGDIDGLRAISILAVVLFHAGVASFAGGYVGVDVFFVISGFLITGLLAREIDRSGRIAMGEFYARRIRRLLPLSFVTIIGTLLAGIWLLPPVARESLVDDARAASVYVANWRYAGQAAAYSDTEVTDSLLVHYWSLAIEEQFYVLWPLLILAGLGLSRLLRRPTRPILGMLLGGLGLVSFVFSVVITNREGVGAYYLTHTRLWEMSVGAGLALTIPNIRRLPSALLDVIGAIGLAAIAYAALAYDAATPFPGSAALLPVGGCAAVLIAGSQAPGFVARSLAIAPLRLIGRLSYAWYLVHWPSIGIGLLLRRHYDWNLSVGAVTALSVAASLAIAFAVHHAIENPVRHASVLRSRPLPNLVMGVLLTTVPLLVGAGLLANVDRGDNPIEIAAGGQEIVLVQTPAEAISDDVVANPDCHLSIAETAVVEGCVFGDPNGERVAVLLGDSHARQWVDALDQIGREEGIKLFAWTKSACSIIDADVYLPVQERRYDECGEWRDNVVDHIADMERIDVILLARAGNYVDIAMAGNSRVDADDVASVWQPAFTRTAALLAPLADEVVLIADTPWPGFSPPQCLSEGAADISDCSFPLADSLRDAPLLEVEQEVAPEFGIRIVQAASIVCVSDPCSVVTPGGLITYRDTHHLTRSFTLSLVDEIRSWITG